MFSAFPCQAWTPGALKCHHSSRSEHQFITCLGVSAQSFFFVLDKELPKPCDQNILAGLKCRFDDAQHGIYCTCRLESLQVGAFVNRVNDVGLGEGHGRGLLCFECGYVEIM